MKKQELTEESIPMLTVNLPPSVAIANVYEQWRAADGLKVSCFSTDTELNYNLVNAQVSSDVTFNFNETSVEISFKGKQS